VLRVAGHEHFVPPIARTIVACPPVRQRRHRERAFPAKPLLGTRIGRPLPRSVAASECYGQGGHAERHKGRLALAGISRSCWAQILHSCVPTAAICGGLAPGVSRVTLAYKTSLSCRRLASLARARGAYVEIERDANLRRDRVWADRGLTDAHAGKALCSSKCKLAVPPGSHQRASAP
jgi:hypothetical protein